MANTTLPFVATNATVKEMIKEKDFRRLLEDESTYSNINDLYTEHYDLEIDLDFTSKVFHGKQTIYMKTKKPFVDHVTLDISDLTIKNITDKHGNSLNYTVTEPNPEIGQSLDIKIAKRWFPRSSVILVISYDTSTDAGAVTWLDKEQTSGKKKPYVYTQCQSIYARSIAPLQDTPAIKSTYNLHITSPHEIVVRASGNITHEYEDEDFRHSFF